MIGVRNFELYFGRDEEYCPDSSSSSSTQRINSTINDDHSYETVEKLDSKTLKEGEDYMCCLERDKCDVRPLPLKSFELIRMLINAQFYSAQISDIYSQNTESLINYSKENNGCQRSSGGETLPFVYANVTPDPNEILSATETYICSIGSKKPSPFFKDLRYDVNCEDRNPCISKISALYSEYKERDPSICQTLSSITEDKERNLYMPEISFRDRAFKRRHNFPEKEYIPKKIYKRMNPTIFKRSTGIATHKEIDSVRNAERKGQELSVLRSCSDEMQYSDNSQSLNDCTKHPFKKECEEKIRIQAKFFKANKVCESLQYLFKHQMSMITEHVKERNENSKNQHCTVTDGYSTDLPLHNISVHDGAKKMLENFVAFPHTFVQDKTEFGKDIEYFSQNLNEKELKNHTITDHHNFETDEDNLQEIFKNSNNSHHNFDTQTKNSHNKMSAKTISIQNSIRNFLCEFNPKDHVSYIINYAYSNLETDFRTRFDTSNNPNSSLESQVRDDCNRKQGNGIQKLTKTYLSKDKKYLAHKYEQYVPTATKNVKSSNDKLELINLESQTDSELDIYKNIRLTSLNCKKKPANGHLDCKKCRNEKTRKKFSRLNTVLIKDIKRSENSLFFNDRKRKKQKRSQLKYSRSKHKSKNKEIIIEVEKPLQQRLNHKNMLIEVNKKLDIVGRKLRLSVKGNRIYLIAKKRRIEKQKCKEKLNSKIKCSESKKIHVKTASKERSSPAKLYSISNSSKNEETTLEEMEAFLQELRANTRKTAVKDLQQNLRMVKHQSEKVQFLDKSQAQRKTKLMTCVSLTPDAAVKEANILKDIRMHRRDLKTLSDLEIKKNKLLQKFKAETDSIITAYKSSQKYNKRHTISEAEKFKKTEIFLNTLNNQTTKRKDKKLKQMLVSFAFKRPAAKSEKVSEESHTGIKFASLSEESQSLLNTLRAKIKAKKSKKC
ncbi:uncharacterized protein LOC118203469 [Stegodyphus dumicola]|uniref:uncharacterized protein LOC118203469 n=1 Tax=Stegodyphus dumicola TaxID=202533 RepID=UPI0015AE13E8|nr:uncharacterized protein LOC118203469 [Stegodyphus dumicola]